MGRFVNQDRDHSLHNKQDSRGSETLLGQFVSYPDKISQQSEFGIVRTSGGSSAVEKPTQLTDNVLRGHFIDKDFPSKTDPRQEQIV